MRTTTYLFIAICCITLCVFKSNAESEDGRATVKSDTLIVYSRISSDSKKVKELKKEKVVTIEFEFEGAEGAWCGIMEEGQTTTSGYVHCQYLERVKPQKKIWQRVGETISHETKVTIYGNEVLVPVTLDYGGTIVQALLLLDTGASRTVISAEIAARLNINLDQTEKEKGQVVGGGLVEARLTKLNSITVGPHTRTDMRIAIIEHKGPAVKHDGLLGMDFLRNLRYHIEFDKQIINWMPQK
jgi:clan AA aspartic protease (TIGR02281 family)